VNNELKRILMEVFMAKFMIYSKAFFEGKRKTKNNPIYSASGQDMNLEVSEYRRVLTICA
jgi:hypothetical protein